MADDPAEVLQQAELPERGQQDAERRGFAEVARKLGEVQLFHKGGLDTDAIGDIPRHEVLRVNVKALVSRSSAFILSLSMVPALAAERSVRRSRAVL